MAAAKTVVCRGEGKKCHNEFAQETAKLFKTSGLYDLDALEIFQPMTTTSTDPEDFSLSLWCDAYRYLEIVKILASLSDNPNAPDNYGCTPIFYATKSGQTEIVRYLAPLCHNPNSPNRDGTTPLFVAARLGHLEIIKILAPYCDNPLVQIVMEKIENGKHQFAQETTKLFKTSGLYDLDALEIFQPMITTSTDSKGFFSGSWYNSEEDE